MAGALHTDEYRSVVRGLVEARKSAGLSQAVLAARIGRPPSYVAKVELCERRLDVVEFCRIALALSLDPFDYLREKLRAMEYPTDDSK
ncbi:helix-turn-helix domain-containing protein [Antarctobacter jejuensis]|uniref:helix-turn-helix domain-containing protein n=1 Tax=Antarctobacter jejuensis TaxID=1439938 RepID=UPI003FD43225